MVVAVDVDEAELAVEHADFLLLAPVVEGVGGDIGGVSPEDEDFFSLRVGAFHRLNAATLLVGSATLGEDGKADQPNKKVSGVAPR